MSSRIDHNEIWDPKLWDDTDAKTLLGTLNSLDKELVSISTHAKKVVESLDFKTLGSIQKANKEFERSNKIYKQGDDLIKKRVSLEKKLNQETTKQAKENAVLNERLKDQRRINRELGKEKAGLLSAYDKESKRLRELRKRYKDLAVQEKGSTREARRLRKEITALDSRLKRVDDTVGQNQRSVGKYRNALKGLRGSFTRLAGSLGLVGGIAALGRVLRNSFNKIVDFQKANADLAGVLGKTRKEITELTRDAKSLGSSTKFTASQVTGLQKEYAKLGFAQDEILNVTEATLTLATATTTELPRAAEVVGNTLRAFQLDSSETQRVVDVMTKSFNVSALDMEKFSTAMATVAPVAKTAGFSIERTTAVIGTLASNGIDASTAGTALRNIFLELSKSGMTFQQAMSEINDSTNKNATALDLFGKRGAAVATIIAENVDQIDDLNISLANAGGTAEKVANEQMNTLRGEMDQLSSAWEGFIFSLESGDGVISRVFSKAINFGTELLNTLTQLNTTQNEFNNLAIQGADKFASEVASADISSLNTGFRQLNASTEQLLQDIEDYNKGLETVNVTNSRELAFARNIVKLRKEGNDELVIAAKLAEVTVRSAEKETGFNRDSLELAKKQAEEARKRADEIAKISDEKLGSLIQLDEDKVLFDEKLLKTVKDFKERLTEAREEAQAAEVNYQVLNQTLGKSQKAMASFLQQKTLDELEVFAKRRLPENIRAALELAIANKKAAEGQAELNKSLKSGSKQAEREKTRLEKLREELNEVQRLREKNFSVNKDLSDQEFITLTQKADALKNEIEFIEETIDLKLKKIKLEEEEQKTIDDRIAESAKATEEELKRQKEILDQQAKDEEDRIKREQENKEKRIQFIREETEAFLTSRFEKSVAREEDINEEIRAAQKREEQLAEIAREGQLNAAESLAAERKKIAELQRKELEEQKRQENIKLTLAALDLLVAKINQGVDDPAGEAGKDMLNLVGLINSLPGFFHGTDDTGNKGLISDSYGPITGFTHDGEQVWSKKDREEVGNRNRKEIKEIVGIYESGMILPNIAFKAPVMNTTPFMGNEQVIEQFNELKKEVKEVTNAINNKPVQWFEVDQMTGYLVECVEEKNKITRVHHKKRIEF